MNNYISKSADKTLKFIYKVYLKRLKTKPYFESRYFSHNVEQDDFRPFQDKTFFSFDYISELLDELHSIGIVQKSPAGDAILQTKGIVYMEYRWQNTFLKWFPVAISVLSFIISAISLAASFMT